MSKMSELHLTIVELLEQGSNAGYISNHIGVPLEWVKELEKEVKTVEYTASFNL